MSQVLDDGEAQSRRRESARREKRNAERATRVSRPDPTDLSRFELIAAWQLWDVRPGDGERANRFADELGRAAALLGLSTMELHDRLVANLPAVRRVDAGDGRFVTGRQDYELAAINVALDCGQPC